MTGRRAITATIVIVAVIAFLGVLVWKPQIDPIEPPKPAPLIPSW
jgi:hypothetical protein